MRGGCVDHASVAVFVEQGDRLDRGSIGQAQDREIGEIERVAARDGLLALLVRQADKLEFGAVRQPLGDLQPGGARGPVDEDRIRHQSTVSSRSIWI